MLNEPSLEEAFHQAEPLEWGRGSPGQGSHLVDPIPTEGPEKEAVTSPKEILSHPWFWAIDVENAF